MDLNRGIERLILLLSILVGTTIVVMTAQSDYTLGGSFHSGAEIVLGHMFLWTSGFAGVWVIYGAAVFLVKGFNNVTISDADETITTEINYHPLPEKETPKVQAPPVILSWKEQIERVRRASSRQRIRLIDNSGETRIETTPSRTKVTGDKVKFHCRFCSQKIVVAKTHAGKRGQCMKCKKVLLIPGAKPRLAVGTGMSAISQVLTKAKKQAESRKAAWDNIQAELITGGRVAQVKEEVIAEIKQEVKAEPAKVVEAIAPVKEEKIPDVETISEKAKEAVSAIEQVKAEAKVKAKELTDMLNSLKTETEEKIRDQAHTAAKAVAAEIKAHAKAAIKVHLAKPKAKAKSKAKAKANAKAKVTAKAKAKPKAKATKPKSIDIKELVQKARKTKKAKTVKA